MGLFGSKPNEWIYRLQPVFPHIYIGIRLEMDTRLVTSNDEHIVNICTQCEGIISKIILPSAISRATFSLAEICYWIILHSKCPMLLSATMSYMWAKERDREKGRTYVARMWRVSGVCYIPGFSVE